MHEDVNTIHLISVLFFNSNQVPVNPKFLLFLSFFWVILYKKEKKRKKEFGNSFGSLNIVLLPTSWGMQADMHPVSNSTHTVSLFRASLPVSIKPQLNLTHLNLALDPIHCYSRTHMALRQLQASIHCLCRVTG